MSETRVTLGEETKDLVDELPPDLQREVRDFARYLVETKKRPRPHRKPTFAWRGALKDLRDQYTSVELQHEITRWMGDER